MIASHQQAEPIEAVRLQAVEHCVTPPVNTHHP